MTKVVPNQRRATLLPVIKENVKRHSIVHTDEAGAYLTINAEGFYHMSVNHSAGQYVGAQGTSVNSIEGFWAQLKRSRSEEHTSELQSLMRISYAVFCLKKKK